jgi:uncharacterized protein YceK/TolB-like protein
MRTYSASAVILSLILLAAMLAASGCSSIQQRQARKPDWKPSKVAVLPFEYIAPNPGGVQAVSPLTGSVFSAHRTSDGKKGLKMLDAALDKWLHKQTHLQVVSSALTGPVFREQVGKAMGGPLNKSIAQTGKKLNADGILVGYLYRFARRVGTGASVDKPASVALDISLVRAADGAVIWKNSFDERQVSLSENMFNLGNYMTYGLSWYTAEQFSVLGLNEAMKAWPWPNQ